MRKGNSKLLIRNLRKMEEKKQLNIGVVTKRTYKCLGCKHYDVKVVNGKGGTARTCNVNKKDVRIIVDLDAPNCTDYVYGW